MLGTTLPEVHKWLVDHGYVRDTTETRLYAYDGSIQCNQVKVPIRFSFGDLSFQKLPDIYLREPRPDDLCRPLSHVDHHGKLCYLTEGSFRLDPYRPLQTIVTLLGQAERVLIDSLAGSNRDDVGYEFRSYWEPIDTGLVLLSHQTGHSTKYNRLEYESPTETKHKQIVVGSAEEIDVYREWRQGILKHHKHQNALWINVHATVLLPEKDPWPPKNFKAFYEWLKNVDPPAANIIQQQLGTKIGAHSPLLIVLNTPGGFVGVEVHLSEKLLSSMKAPSRFRKQLLIDRGLSGTKFIRIIFDDFSPKFQTTRNLLCSGLSGKRIVLIGCGNIGGYLSRLLVQSGAGQGAGKLELYDKQILSAGNVGRHYLDGTYLYENKAKACAHKLISEFPTANVYARPKNFIDVSDVSNADILIDATGQELFSLSLNEQIVKRRKENCTCPVALYVWIDGNGYCGRTLFYDGSGGCYRCLQDVSGRDRFESLSTMKDLVPMSYRCGESYIPYPPSISVQAAGIGLDAVLDWASGKPGHHFRHRRFHEKARQHKNQHLKPVRECPACQG